MLARNETILKWVLYAAATVLCLAVQEMFLQRFTFWGVIPFVYPLLAAIPAAYEGPVPGTAFALAVGVACDLILPGPIPCFYTLAFFVVAVTVMLIAKHLIVPGLLCAFLVSILSIVLCDLLQMLFLSYRAGISLLPALLLMGKELISVACMPLVYFPYRWLHKRTAVY